MNPWLQTKEYICRRCGETYTHDRGYHHNLFRCPKRSTEKIKMVVGKTFPQEVRR
jgi:DNA-directed RNA polymerase subunit RPC12/RpoP